MLLIDLCFQLNEKSKQAALLISVRLSLLLKLRLRLNCRSNYSFLPLTIFTELCSSLYLQCAKVLSNQSLMPTLNFICETLLKMGTMSQSSFTELGWIV